MSGMVRFFVCCSKRDKTMAESILILDSEANVVEQLAKIVEEKANKAIEERNAFNVGLSGASLVNFLCKGLPNITTDWKKWKLFFCDERVVPFEDNDSTFKQYRDNLLGKVPLDENQFVIIDPNLPCREAADDYETKLRNVFPQESFPRFDLLLLGVGPDGHTCSLFPGHALLEENKRWVAPIEDSPKPPPCRVTLTYPVINNARACVFTAAGAGKADMIERLLKLNEDLPARRVKPTKGELIWILDKAAAAKLE